MDMPRCTDCKDYRYNFVSSEVDGEVEWVECLKKPQVANLKQFPFWRTNCAVFQTA